MTNEEKQLLLKDLCGRLPYGVKCQIDYDNEEDTDLGIERYCDDRIVSVCIETEEIGLYEASEYFYPNDIKPYLRPISSMTDGEKKELAEEQKKDENLFLYVIKKSQEGNDSLLGTVIPHYAEDWANKNMFDYRGLIPMGLALEAPEDMYGKI